MRTLLSAVLIGACALALASCSKYGAARAVSEASSGPVTQADLHPCDVTGKEMTDADCAAARTALDQSKPGAAAFTAPTWMFQGQEKTVTLAVSAAPAPQVAQPAASSAPAEASDTVPDTSDSSSAPASDAAAAPGHHHHHGHVALVPETPHDVAAAAAQGTGSKVIDYHPLVGHRMTADLEGGGFEITALSSHDQPVVDGAVTTWEWRVKARDFGKKTLFLKTAVVMIDSQNQTVALVPTTTPKVVDVWVGLPFFAKLPDALKWLAAVLGAAAAVVAAWRVLRKKPQDPPPGGKAP